MNKLMKVVISVDVGNLDSEYQEYIKECQKDGSEINSFEDFYRMEMEEFASQVGGRIWNFGYFSIEDVEYSLVDDDENVRIKIND